MPRRTVSERVARVERRLLPVVATLCFLAGLWLAGGVSLALLVVAAAGLGFAVRPTATAVVQRRLSLWALLGDDDAGAEMPALLPAAEDEHRGVV